MSRVKRCILFISLFIIGGKLVNAENIDLSYGDWELPLHRSIPSVVLTAETSNGYLHIEYPNPSYDLTVSIQKVQGNSEVFRGVYPSPACSSISIPLTGFGKGIYVLYIYNNEGGVITGVFSI
jgi:hypothetical protein